MRSAAPVPVTGRRSSCDGAELRIGLQRRPVHRAVHPAGRGPPRRAWCQPDGAQRAGGGGEHRGDDERGPHGVGDLFRPARGRQAGGGRDHGDGAQAGRSGDGIVHSGCGTDLAGSTDHITVAVSGPRAGGRPTGHEPRRIPMDRDNAKSAANPRSPWARALRHPTRLPGLRLGPRISLPLPKEFRPHLARRLALVICHGASPAASSLSTMLAPPASRSSRCSATSATMGRPEFLRCMLSARSTARRIAWSSWASRAATPMTLTAS